MTDIETAITIKNMAREMVRALMVKNATGKNSYESDFKRWQELKKILSDFNAQKSKAYDKKDYNEVDKIQRKIDAAYKEWNEIDKKMEKESLKHLSVLK